MLQFAAGAEAAGVRFTCRNGEEAGRYSILESLGGGVAIRDLDRDDALDLVLAGGGSFDAAGRPLAANLGLFRQTGFRTFREIATPSFLPAAGHYNHGLSVADADNDGFDDLLVTGFGGLQLLRNLGDGTFEDVTAESGLLDQSWSTGAAWTEINNDGVLDLFVVHYVACHPDRDPPCFNAAGQREVCSPLAFPAVTDQLWIGDGHGRFLDATNEVGIEAGGKGIAAVAADLDRDGLVDLYVANDTTARRLYHNVGGRLEEIGLPSGAALSPHGQFEGSMGTVAGDYNGDGYPDLWVANFEDETFSLFQNQGALSFSYVSPQTGLTGLSREYVGWGVVFSDLDGDGDDDVFVANGHVERRPRSGTPRQHAVLMQNELVPSGTARYRNIAAASGDYFAKVHNGRGAAAGDLDADGDDDLVVSHINEPVEILWNETEQQGRPASMRLIGRAANRSAIGATAWFESTPIQTRLLPGGGSYASTSAPRLTFRVGPTEPEIRLQIHWPGLSTPVDASLPVDRRPQVLVQPQLPLSVPHP